MEKIISSLLGMILGSIISIIIITLGDDKNKYPTAIDVYKGKTTLEITYRDSVAIDSVVIFKNK